MRVYDDNGLTEQEYLERYAKKQYPKPSLTADIVILSKDTDAYSVLLVRRRNHPFLDFWALPGGFANPNEPVEQTAARELAEETGVEGLSLRLVGVYSGPGRDPRGWVVSAAFCACADSAALHVEAGDDARDAAWFRISRQDGKLLLLPRTPGAHPISQLAFDHETILCDALRTVSDADRGIS